jgi:hypothetical protein
VLENDRLSGRGRSAVNRRAAAKRYGLLAGYQIQSLRSEAQRLAGEQASLELQEAKLVSPARMEQLARQQQFIDPEPEKVVYLDSKDGSSLALNQKR